MVWLMDGGDEMAVRGSRDAAAPVHAGADDRPG